MSINRTKIPAVLAERPQWVLWRLVERENDKPTKMPFQSSGRMAKSDTPETWTTLEHALDTFDGGGYSGIGYVFSADDPFVGVDLDGCRNPETGEIAEWAKEIIRKLDTYGEVSPSKTGVKLWVIGTNPLGATGRKIGVADVPAITDKQPAIEIYDRTRYFAVTGWRLKGVPDEPERGQEGLQWLAEKYFPAVVETASTAKQEWHGEDAVVERARKYIAKLPPAVSGSKGHDVTFHAACVLVLGFGLPESLSLMLLQEWNQACQPPWSDRELLHKVKQANKQGGARNYLRIAKPETYDKIAIPAYRAPPPEPEKPQPRASTLANSMKACLDSIRNGKTELVSLGIGELDYAIGGGVEPGEMIVMAARPSHGKSAMALQCVHHWTALGKKVLLISEEMSSLALGKRALQFFSDVPEEDWQHSLSQLDGDVSKYAASHAPAYIAESCGTCEVAVQQIEKYVVDHKIEAVIVDYAQILQGFGKSRYEQVSNTSTVMKQVAAKHRLILILLCQLSRGVEQRKKFIPMMSDIKESGQFEQDADTILFLVWPHRIDSSNPAEEYQIFVAKNRNRAIHKAGVNCKFKPSRQMITETDAKSMPNYTPGFDSYNNQHEEPFV